MATPSAIPADPPRETVKRIHRVTREKRNLWYVLTVLQQPERARACGSGMKANSDRRPVDPPPVVELRIYEGASAETGKLITFEYNANFFLYASLEAARPIAQGRVQNSALNNPPILTGVPASGMAYLDKPSEAGYFIFPDLSVRHEGTYKLSFSLFEITKEEKDYDLEPPEAHIPNGADWRMEIETAPFSVYSAKKFPGLMESTALSRTVAEQGCRVRIRRDVRMRKRDRKPNHTERCEPEYTRHRTVTPAPSEEARTMRNRSISNSSEQRAPYPHDPQRRPSMADSYPPPTPSSASYDHAPTPSRGHLHFDQSAQAYGAARPSAPPVGVSPYHSAANPPYIEAETPSHRYQDHRTGVQPSLPSTQVIKCDPYERRPSASTYIPPSPSMNPIDNNGYRRDSYLPSLTKPILPAPVRPHLLPSQYRSPMSIHTLISDRPIEPQPPLEVGRALPAPAQMFKAGDKRKREQTFIENSSPLYNGRRQQDYHHGDGQLYRPDFGTGVFRRADGREICTPFKV